MSCHPTGTQGNTAGSFAHEAGYDAYMTAASFATLLRLLELRRGDGAGFDVLGADCVAEPPSLDAAAEFLGQLNLVRWAAALQNASACQRLLDCPPRTSSFAATPSLDVAADLLGQLILVR